jgi:hypothetical protein
MKIRTGFVSNSSSSSFLVIATMANHTKAMAALDEFKQDVVCKVMKTDTVFGQQMMVGQTYDAHGEGTFDNMVRNWTECDIEGDDAEDPDFDFQDEAYRRVYDAWNEYLGELNKNPDEVFVTLNDF